jgi:hypothetical protein
VTHRIISDTQVPHRADTQGVVVTRRQLVEVDGQRFECLFWHDWNTGRLVRVDSRAA